MRGERVFWILLQLIVLSFFVGRATLPTPSRGGTVSLTDSIVLRQKPCELPSGETDPGCVRLERIKAYLDLGLENVSSQDEQRLGKSEMKALYTLGVPTTCEKRDPGTGECLLECGPRGQNNQNCRSLVNKNYEQQEITCKPTRCASGLSSDAVCYRCERVQRTVCLYSPFGIAACTKEIGPGKSEEGGG